MSERISVEERWVLENLAEAWNGFIKLDRPHPDDAEEFRRAIHAAQNLIAFRVARRVDPDVWSNEIVSSAVAVARPLTGTAREQLGQLFATGRGLGPMEVLHPQPLIDCSFCREPICNTGTADDLGRPCHVSCYHKNSSSE